MFLFSSMVSMTVEHHNRSIESIHRGDNIFFSLNVDKLNFYSFQAIGFDGFSKVIANNVIFFE